MWCIPKITPKLREQMYDILDRYAEPYDPKRPVIRLDEKPKQLIEDVRKPIPMRLGRPERYDYEYVRKGNANIFMAAEFKAGRRTTRVTCRRTKKDFAKFIKISQMNLTVTVEYKKSGGKRHIFSNFNPTFLVILGKNHAIT